MERKHHRSHPRVVVAVDDTLAGYAALRVAVGLARRSSLPLEAISASLAVGSTDAAASIDRVFEEAMAGTPIDIEILKTVRFSSPSTALTESATHPQDLIVVGGDGPGLLRRLWRGSTARNVLARARCQVLVVPAPEMQRATRHSIRRLRRPRTDVWGRFETEVPELRGEPFQGI
jgi:nucleotide-binding universal stress UspA family protein